jgi:hypothetical protein
MTSDAIINMRGKLSKAVAQLRYARNVLGVSAHSDVSTRNVSIAITELETALIWSRRALEARELSVKELGEGLQENLDPKPSLERAGNEIDSFINPLKSEYKAGASDPWYRNAILNIINHLEVSRDRIQRQISEL